MPVKNIIQYQQSQIQIFHEVLLHICGCDFQHNSAQCKAHCNYCRPDSEVTWRQSIIYSTGLVRITARQMGLSELQPFSFNK